MSHFDSFVSVCKAEVEGRSTSKSNATHIVVVLAAAREVLLPLGLIQCSLGSVNECSTEAMHDYSPQMGSSSLVSQSACI